MESAEDKVEPFGRQPQPVSVTITGHELDVDFWVRHLFSAASYKGDNVERKPALILHNYPKMEATFYIYPRAVND
jgi:hypothetical protein